MLYKLKENEIDFYKFKQFLAENDLKKAKEKLNQKGLKLDGDMICGLSFDETALSIIFSSVRSISLLTLSGILFAIFLMFMMGV